MGKKLKAVDGYIGKAAPFARPILRHLRGLVHETCPEVEEVIKWGMPHFDYKGPFFYMAAFKQHAACGFWKHKLVTGAGDANGMEAMGQFGKLARVEDLPSDKQLAGYIRKAMKLNESGVKLPRPLKHAKKPLTVPKVLTDALKKNAKARKTFEAFSPSNQREYAEWIAEAKSDDTRQRRLAQAIEWMAAGKIRHWKYQKK